MPNFNLPAVTDWAIFVVTAPPAPGPSGATFAFRMDVFLNNNPQPVNLQINSVEELSAIVGVLQIPGGRLLFNPIGQTLIKSLG